MHEGSKKRRFVPGGCRALLILGTLAMAGGACEVRSEDGAAAEDVDGRPAPGQPDRRSAVNEANHRPGDREGFAVLLWSDRPAYRTGESLEFGIALRNGSDRPLTLEFATGQRYDFSLESEDGEEHWRWSEDRMFTQALGEERLAPGDSLAFAEALAGELAPGRYSLVGRVPATNRPVEARLTVIVER